MPPPHPRPHAVLTQLRLALRSRTRTQPSRALPAYGHQRTRQASSAVQRRDDEEHEHDRLGSASSSAEFHATVRERFPLYAPESLRSEDEAEALATALEEAMDLRGRGNYKSKAAELEHETRDLQDVVRVRDKIAATEDLTRDLPPYTEADLEAFYLALAEPARTTKDSNAQINGPQHTREFIGAGNTDKMDARLLRNGNLEESRREAIEGLVERLHRSGLAEATPGEGPMEPAIVAARGAEGIDGQPSDQEDSVIATPTETPIRRAALHTLQSAAALLQPDPATNSSLSTAIPIATRHELQALFEDLLVAREYEPAARVLSIAGTIGLSATAAWTEAMLADMGHSGQSEDIVKWLAAHRRSPPDLLKRAYSYLVRAHLRNRDYAQAISTVQSLEAQHIYLPQRTYAAVMRGLIAPIAPGAPISQHNKAVAWDFFARTQLTAYAQPSLEMYTLMIRSCADPRDPQPERALDVWAEMRDEGTAPDQAAYEAIILACARVKKFYMESFRLFREMLTASRSGFGHHGADDPTIAFRPTIRLMNALLEGTKRHADLPRARWILAETFKLAEMGALRPNASTLVGVFQTYAAYKPVLSRGAIKQVKLESSDGTSSVEPERPIASTPQDTDSAPLNLTLLNDDRHGAASPDVDLLDVASPNFAPPAGPQTAQEVLREASRLFELVRRDVASGDATQTFAQVVLDTRVINAYLAVHLAHAPLGDALTAWDSIWRDLPGVERDGWSYLAAVQRCAIARNQAEKEVVRNLTPVIWQQYHQWVERMERDVHVDEAFHGLGLGPREVEKTWVAVIRIWTILGNPKQALALVSQFTKVYPPPSLAATPADSIHLQTSVRLSSPAHIREDNVPPHLLFSDVEALHARLVLDENTAGINMLTWACRSYEGMLRMRRRLRAVKQ